MSLHKALDAAGVPNQFYTVKGGGHGGFMPEENQKIWAAIRQFLDQHLPHWPRECRRHARS